MTVLHGEMWRELGRADLILVTTNAMVTRDHRLVMGRGAALEMKQRYPGIDAMWGHCLEEGEVVSKQYGVMIATHFYSDLIPRETALGIFQVKRHWRDPADTRLIGHSAAQLAEAIKDNAYRRVVLNYPGIGNGRLTREQVEPVLERHLGKYGNLYLYVR